MNVVMENDSAKKKKETESVGNVINTCVYYISK